ncbi:MAG: hypothetical protein WA883_21670 [Phormidesmis sp.]
MNKNLLWQLGIFVAVLLALNLVFQMHISIIGSLLLTVALSFVFNAISNRR